MIVTHILRKFAVESIYFIAFSVIERNIIYFNKYINTMNKRYFFLLTLLFAFLGGVKSEAQITATSQLTNAKAYTIKSAGRGYLYYNPSASTTVLYSTSSGATLTNDTPDGTQVNNQFAFLRGLNTASGQYYLYSVGAQKFVNISATASVGGQSVRGMVFSETPTADSKITLTSGTTSGTSGFVIKYANASGWQVNVTNWNHYSSSGIKIYNNTDVDAGSVMVIKEAAESFDGLAAAMNKIYEFEGDHVRIQNIINNCEAEKIGYPTKTSGAYSNFLTAYSNGTLENSHLTALYASTDVNMPVEGHAYTFTFKHMNGTRTYLYWNGNKITSAVGTSLPETATFVCHKVDTKYMFVNPSSGNYLVWWGGSGDGAYESNNGFTSAYDSGKNLFQVVKFLTGDNVQATNEELFGCVGLKGTRSSGDAPYFILKNTAGGAVASSAPYVDKTTTNANYRSCAVMIEEVEYYNKLVFRSPATPDGKYYASIYLPYAATVPTGATAYLGTLNGSSIRLTDIQGSVIPKNTAVVMVAESDLTTQYVAPATEAGSVPAGVTNNLEGTLTTTETTNSAFADTYVLNGSFGNIGFYKYTADYLPKGRAYFEVVSSGVQGFLFDFEGSETTGINAAALSDSNAAKTYYDLSGRRVASPKHGLYICNGKKVYIK